jgi:hypothetical protein
MPRAARIANLSPANFSRAADFLKAVGSPSFAAGPHESVAAAEGSRAVRPRRPSPRASYDAALDARSRQLPPSPSPCAPLRPRRAAADCPAVPLLDAERVASRLPE